MRSACASWPHIGACGGMGAQMSEPRGNAIEIALVLRNRTRMLKLRAKIPLPPHQLQ